MQTIENWLKAKLTDETLEKQLDEPIYGYFGDYVNKYHYNSYLKNLMYMEGYNVTTFQEMMKHKNIFNTLSSNLTSFRSWLDNTRSNQLNSNTGTFFYWNTISNDVNKVTVSESGKIKPLSEEEVQAHANNYTKLIELIRVEIIKARKESIRTVAINLQESGFELDAILTFIQPMLYNAPTNNTDPNDGLSMESVDLVKEILEGLFPPAEVEECCAEMGVAEDSSAERPPVSTSSLNSAAIYNVGTLNNTEGGVININDCLYDKKSN